MEQNPKPDLLTKYVIWVAGGVIGLILTIYIFTFIAVGSPKTCASCHEIRRDYETWKQTAHEVFDCSWCHESPSAFRRFGATSRVIRETFTHLTGSYSKVWVTKEIPNSNCQQCHVPWRQITPSGDLRLPHKIHYEELGMKCTYCHARVAHLGKIRGRLTTKPPMILCMQCHDGKKKIKGRVATAACKACHTEKIIPKSHYAANWYERHGILAEKSTERAKCASCHAYVLNFCQECHKNRRPSTHVGGEKWKSLHRQRAHERAKTCIYICHSRNFCMRCHDQALFAVRLKGKI